MNKRTVAFDLETIADHERLKTLPPPETKLGNTKDEEKIKAKMAEAKEKRLAWHMRYGVHIWPCPGRAFAEKITYLLLDRFYRDQIKASYYDQAKN